MQNLSPQNNKIWIISHSCGGKFIGPNKRVFLLGKNLSKSNYVNIYASQFFHKYLVQPDRIYSYSSKLRIFYLKNIKYRSFIGQFFNQIIFPISLFFKLLKDFNKKEPDIIIFSSPPPFAFLGLLPFLNFSKRKLIVDVRDLWPEILIDLHRKSFIFSLYLSLIKKIIGMIYLKANHIVSVKEGDLSFIKENYNTKAKFHFIPNAYTEEETIIDNTFRHNFLDKDFFLVTYAGALSSYYTLNELIDLAKKCIKKYPKIRFLIAGGGKDLESYKLKSSDLSNINFIGQQPKEVINFILSKSHLGFLPLKKNEFNKHGISTNKLYDYMFHSLPVLGLYQNDYDIVEKFKFGLVEKNYCSKDLFSKLIQLYQMDSKELKKMGYNGKNLLEKEYLPSIVANKFEKVFNA